MIERLALGALGSTSAMTRILALLAVLAVIIVALRPRERPAVMRPPSWVEPEDGVQPADPYPASLLT